MATIAHLAPAELGVSDAGAQPQLGTGPAATSEPTLQGGLPEPSGDDADRARDDLADAELALHHAGHFHDPDEIAELREERDQAQARVDALEQQLEQGQAQAEQQETAQDEEEL